MRCLLLFVPLTLAAVPASAAPVQVPLQLSDPQLANHLGEMMHALSRVVLDLHVGEIQAAAEGREPTDADRRRTVRSETGLDQRQLDRTIEQSSVAMQQGIKAMAEAIPKIADAVQSAKQEVESAAGNMPLPDYPKR